MTASSTRRFPLAPRDDLLRPLVSSRGRAHVGGLGVIRPPTPSDVHIYYHRPPDRTDRFVQRLIYDDPWVKITFAERLSLARPLVIDGEVALEDGADAIWFTFPGAWHDIGRFHRADGTLTGIYANILTPCTFEPGGVWHTTDLFLDLWIPTPSGRWDPGRRAKPQLLDLDELGRAEVAGWVPSDTAYRARAEAARLVEAAMEGKWPAESVGEWPRERIRS